MMCFTCKPGQQSSKNTMASETMCEGKEKIFSKECVRLLSNPDRFSGVKSESKYAKRESNAMVKKRYYHLQKHEDINHTNIKSQLKGLDNSTPIGIRSHYNIRVDYDLGLSFAAIRRLPCACTACLEQLDLNWDINVLRHEQPRYARNPNCHYWPLFEGLNDWKILSCKINDEHYLLQDMKEEIIQSHADHFYDKIRIDDIDAVHTTDVDGFYFLK